MKKITGMQIRMARIALKWRVDDLSKASDVGWARIQNMEKSNDLIDNEQVDKITETFLKKGINFFDDDDQSYPYIKVNKNA
tara:strand:+ start:552 stop:794 length:243 start_codon:yes stop_codon:yes gene_type:complete